MQERPHARPRHAVPVEPQPVPRLQPRLPVLLRQGLLPPDGPRPRRRIRSRDRGEDQLRRRARARASAATRWLGRAGDGHRSVPAVRRPISRDARCAGSARAPPDAALDHHEGHAHPARPRSARGAWAPCRAQDLVEHHDGRPDARAEDRARRSAAGEAPGGDPADARRGPPLRGPAGPGRTGPDRRRARHAGGRARGPRRRRGGVRLPPAEARSRHEGRLLRVRRGPVPRPAAAVHRTLR